ncbi:MAG: hypothetical protein KKA16_11535 [Alphaproteobacteria bacterium]|nr:hypothetical protein [Alphaproteobacteria bacterium]MBU2380829.1 hypothetical protein [Alphaproteobacteria bacterium]
MTVCVAVAVHDCIVFAADSASSLVSTNSATGESQIINVYDHGDKVFNLVKGLPICAMTCGMGNLGNASIATLAKELRRRLSTPELGDWYVNPEAYTMEEIAVKARHFLFDERFNALNPPPPAPHSFEFWIGGYGSDFDQQHEIWKLAIVNGVCDPPSKALPEDYGWLAGGQPNAVTRLLLGHDQNLRQFLIDNSMPEASADAVMSVIQSNSQAPVVFPNMPTRDAIDLADFLVETTKRFVRFLPGADTVGGETDIAVVTKYEGFKWIRRKHFYPAALNPLETDHA